MSESLFSSLPAPSLVVPEHGEEWFLVRMREWARLKDKIDALKRLQRQWHGAGWGLVGIGASAMLSWIPYFAANTAGTPVAVVTLVVGVAALGTGAVALVASRGTGRTIDEAVRDAQIHMYDMESGLSEEQRKQIAAMAGVVINL